MCNNLRGLATDLRSESEESLTRFRLWFEVVHNCVPGDRWRNDRHRFHSVPVRGLGRGVEERGIAGLGKPLSQFMSKSLAFKCEVLDGAKVRGGWVCELAEMVGVPVRIERRGGIGVHLLDALASGQQVVSLHPGAKGGKVV